MLPQKQSCVKECNVYLRNNLECKSVMFTSEKNLERKIFMFILDTI